MSSPVEKDASKTGAEARLTAALRERGYRITSPRLAVYRALCELDGHSTPEEVHRTVNDRSAVSVPTVYAVLDLLDKLGLARRVSSVAGAARFDPRTDEHQHLVCSSCGLIEDLESSIDFEAVRSAASHGSFAADRVDLTVTGLCGRCASSA